MARGPQRLGFQCSCIGCIGLRPALCGGISTRSQVISKTSGSHLSLNRYGNGKYLFSATMCVPFRHDRHTRTLMSISFQNILCNSTVQLSRQLNAKSSATETVVFSKPNSKTSNFMQATFAMTSKII